MTNPKHTDTSRSDLEERWREAERNRLVDRIEALEAKVDGLRDLLVRGYVVCDGDDEDAVAFRNDAHAALKGDSHDQ